MGQFLDHSVGLRQCSLKCRQRRLVAGEERVMTDALLLGLVDHIGKELSQGFASVQNFLVWFDALNL